MEAHFNLVLQRVKENTLITSLKFQLSSETDPEELSKLNMQLKTAQENLELLDCTIESMNQKSETGRKSLSSKFSCSSNYLFLEVSILCYVL